MATPFSDGYRRLVYVTLAATFLVVAWGGIVRVTGSGLGCPDWPLCHGRLLPQLDPATQIEWLHRFLALIAGIGIAGVSAWTVSRYRRHGALLWLSTLAVGFFLLQALLGAITVWLELPHTWVTAHLANAQVLLAILVTHAILVRWPNALAGLARPDRASWLALAAAAGTFLLILSGAYVRGDEATGACTTWPLCDEGAFPAPGPALVHMAHRYIAAAVGVLVLLASLAAWRRRREIPGAGPLAVAALALFLLQVGVGAANPLTSFAGWALALHPALASAVWCVLVALAVVQWRPFMPETATTVRDVVALTKPAIMGLLVLTAVGAMFLASGGVPPFGLLLATVVGGACASGGASALNHYFDRDIDELMRRTRRRPLPAHRIPGRIAIAIGIALNAAAFAVLLTWTNLLAAALALSGTLFYILVYTLWLKRTTAQNIVIGGAAGAVPPLVGWAAVTGSLDVPAWILFALVFFWTPAHFWALALLIREDYERAGVPMLPVVKGDRATAWGILWYAAALLPLSVLLYLVSGAGLLFLGAALVLGAVFVAYALRLLWSGDERRRSVARATYLYSLLYLALLFVAIMVDRTVRL